SAFQFGVCRQVGFCERYFLDIHSWTLRTLRVASINCRVSARLGRLAQSEIHFYVFKRQTRFAKIPSLIIKTMIHFGFLRFGFCL
ncbi:hypothetical protein ACVSYN_004387, partial [Vibrio vulnificus]